MRLEFLHRNPFTICIILCLLYISSGFSQISNPTNTEFSLLTFDKSDGYSIDDLGSIHFDSKGWLWLSGIKYESRDYKLDAKDQIILKFDGKSFYNVPLPNDIIEDAKKMELQKAYNDDFFLKLESEKDTRLVKLNTRTFAFEEIKLPTKSKFEVKKLGDTFLFIQQNTEGNQLFYLNQEYSFELIGRMKTNKNPVGFRIFDLGNHFILDKYTITAEAFPKKRGAKNVNVASITKDNIIRSFFHYKSNVYFDFYEDRTIYRYNEATQTAESTNIFKEDSDTKAIASRLINNDQKGNILVKTEDGNTTTFKIYKDINEAPVWVYKIDQITSKETMPASRDFSKELLIKNGKELNLFLFNNHKIDYFLQENSIRNIAELPKNKALIATDYNGWYTLNFEDNSIAPYWFYVNDKKIIPKFNRDVKLINDTVWANNGKHLVSVPLHSTKAKSFELRYNVSCMTQDQKRIYFADETNTVKSFDKQTHDLTTFIEKDSLIYENIVLLDNTLFAATSKGLRTIQNNDAKLYQPSNNVHDNYIISLLKRSSNEILVGTKTGKLFSFDIEKQLFTLLYEDQLAASIASILIDDKERIWLNTFAGIVALDTSTKNTIRFGKNDGLSHYEANRFSALKLKNGNLVVGTIRGVNHFNPDSLLTSHKKNTFDAKLQYISITKYDPQQKSIQTILNRDYLDTTETITLPAENKNLVVAFGLSNPQLNSNYFYRYRLKNSDWIEIKEKNEIRLLNLESGNYNLEIQALDKIKNEVIASIATKLNVQRFFYESAWFYVLLFAIVLSIILVYSYKWRQANQANYKNKLLKTEIQYKKKDLADFAATISRDQQWNDHLLSKMKEIKEAKGRKKGAALVSLEKEIKEKNNVIQNNFEFQKRIDILSNEFYNSLLKRYPNLSKTEIKLCSLIRLDLDNQDIATLQNIDISSVYKSRYRLRKKLHITSDTDLDAFLKAF